MSVAFVSMDDLQLPSKVARKPRPDWLRVKVRAATELDSLMDTRSIVDSLRLNTVCQEAGCPNIHECWSQKHAALMIMGDRCTRACTFCNVATGKPKPLEADEPVRVAEFVRSMGLKHVVITSVDRDDLEDGGAGHFAECVQMLRERAPETSIELLTPDFLHKGDVWQQIVTSRPDVWNHNTETVPRLYNTVKKGARYFSSLLLLHNVKKFAFAMGHPIFTKSGLIVGLGETDKEIFQVMDDLREAGVDFLTIGQYLQPSKKHAEIDRYVTPEEFEQYKSIALSKGFLMVASGPFVRSSYHADKDFELLRAARLQAEMRA